MAGVVGDYNPLHRRALRPRSRRLSRVFAHGMLTMGMTGRALTDWVGEGAPTVVRCPLHQPGVAR
ncbi:MaoC/PaaZ C-terminal domain-containing protein [Streptomyces sp. KL116D]|uniref:MaoC/PaaZ C-terminal domain-containing protein n=1 Tax=Streptomyces sp. KL116D TaxID=3045152 RepID=UPI00355926C1